MRVFKWLSRFVQWFKGLFRKKKQPSPVPLEKIIPPQEPTNGILVYTVYIPTLDGRFDYLAAEPYSPGEIVTIPFGGEDREIFGIVEKRQRYPLDKLPLPLWKMKYILEKAPEAVTEAYRHLRETPE